MELKKEDLKLLQENCPFCKSSWTEDIEIKNRMINQKTGNMKSSYNFDSCYRRCLKDRCSISNGKHPKLIFQDYHDTVPAELTEENKKLDYLLSNCFNIKHRNAKKDQFSLFKSEDSFTWAYFGYICKHKNFQEIENELNLTGKIKDILFWGTSYYNSNNNEYTRALNEASNLCNEYKVSRSEPDIIICTENEIVFIEVKVDSSNPTSTDNTKTSKYCFNDFYEDFNKSKELYELIRNWTLGNLMAKILSKKFILINLMPAKKVNIEEKSTAQINFTAGIKLKENYHLLSWEELFNCINDIKYKTYLLDRMNNILKA